MLEVRELVWVLIWILLPLWAFFKLAGDILL